jgi:hypothetical protein
MNAWRAGAGNTSLGLLRSAVKLPKMITVGCAGTFISSGRKRTLAVAGILAGFPCILIPRQKNPALALDLYGVTPVTALLIQCDLHVWLFGYVTGFERAGSRTGTTFLPSVGAVGLHVKWRTGS